MDCYEVRREIIGFIRSYLAETPCKGVVIGLSGGLDSAVVAALCIEAAGAEAVDLVAMPYRSSDGSSLEDARRIARHLDRPLEVIDISPPVDSLAETLGSLTNLRLGNMLARMRMIILYDLSASRGRLVVGTGNLSEALLGYSTLWGDTACAFTPIGGLYKTQERKLASVLGLPQWIIEKTPTADLWKGQTDEGEMGISYETADKILFNINERGLSPEELESLGISAKDIKIVLERVKRSEFKRRMPVYPTFEGLPL